MANGGDTNKADEKDIRLGLHTVSNGDASNTSDPKRPLVNPQQPLTASLSPLRGALKLEVSTSTPVVIAGSEFSIYVVIRNPFPVPVTIIATETHIPIELTDEIRKKYRRAKLQQEYIERQRNQNLTHTVKDYFEYRLQLHRVNSDPGPRVATAVGPTLSEPLTSLEPAVIFTDVEAGGNIDIDVGTDWNLSFSNVSSHEVNSILQQINEHKQGSTPDILQPGDSVVKHFNLKTTNWLWFAPIAHTFQIQVRYLIDNLAHVDTVPFELSIRAATESSLVGAVVGSFLGTLVNPSSQFSWNSMTLTLMTSMIFAVIVVVAFARKTNVQQIVSVEDFWGGLFIGFLVGYSGESFVKSVLGTAP